MTDTSLPPHQNPWNQPVPAPDPAAQLLQLHRRILAVVIVLAVLGAGWFLINRHTQNVNARRAAYLECVASNDFTAYSPPCERP